MKCSIRVTTLVAVSPFLAMAWCSTGEIAAAPRAKPKAKQPAPAAAPQPVKVEEPVETGPPEVTVKLRNGTSLQCKLLSEVVLVETDYGLLKVPARDLLVIYQGMRTDAKVLAEIKAAIDDLGSDVFQKREGAEKRLLTIGGPAVPALRVATKDDDAERAERARKVLEKVLAAGGASVSEGDLVVAKRFTISGNLALDGYQVDSSLGKTTIALGEVDSLCRRPLKAPPLLLPANLSSSDVAEIALWRVGAEEPGWIQPTFDDATWKTAETSGSGRQQGRLGVLQCDPAAHYCFRRVFLLESQPAKAALTINAPAYEAFVNGIRVAAGSGTGTHDASSTLKRGINVIAVKAKLRPYSGKGGYMVVGLTAE